MSDALLIAAGTAVLNGAVTWGVVSTKLAWLRRDLDDMREAVRELQRRAMPAPPFLARVPRADVEHA